MSIIVPTILTASRDDIVRKLQLVSGKVDSVQIDIVDGVYAGPATWPYSEGSDAFAAWADAGRNLSDWGNFRYEVDLMVANPEVVAPVWPRLGASRVLIHLESANDLPRLLTRFEQEHGYMPGFAPDLLSLGLAVQIDTDLRVLDDYVSRIDYVQFMGIASIGKQGQPFDKRVLQKIETFRKMHPDMLIQVDGGVSLESAPALLAAGVNRLVVGSALWKTPDVRATLEQFEEIATTYGRYT